MRGPEEVEILTAQGSAQWMEGEEMFDRSNNHPQGVAMGWKKTGPSAQNRRNPNHYLM
jgi:hypothetical protein